jgi:drug/metabolite transporter (DMT)-like permease
MHSSLTAYLFVLLGLVSLGGLGILHKTADHHQCRPAAVNIFLFVWAGLASAGILLANVGPAQVLSVPWRVMAVAGICGGLGSVAILTLQHALRFGQISTSWLIINLSTAIPTVLSIVIYKEEVGLRRGLSFLLVLIALFLLWRDRRTIELAQRETEPADAAVAADERKP